MTRSSQKEEGSFYLTKVGREKSHSWDMNPHSAEKMKRKEAEKEESKRNVGERENHPVQNINRRQTT